MRFFLTNTLKTALTSTLLALSISSCGANTAGSWETIFLEDFEHVGSTNIGPHFVLPQTGDDATKHAWTGAYSGTRVIKLRDGSGPESTLESRLIDVSDYTRIELSFFYRGDGMEEGDAFMVEFQYNDDGAWYPAAEMVAGGSDGFPNGEWINQCLQWILYGGDNVDVTGIKLRLVAVNDDNFDIVYLDDVQLRGTLKADRQTTAPTTSPFDPNTNQCSENSGSWDEIFNADFNVAGGPLYIGGMFENLVDGGNAQKLPGAGEDGTTTVRLREDTETSRIMTKPQDVSNYLTVEGTFDFKFDGMEASQANTNNPDNVIIEYQLDGGSWMTATVLTMDASTYFNGVWYSSCFQLDVADAASLTLRWVAGGDTGNTDFISLDNIVLDGKPSASPTDPPSNNACTDTTTDWPFVFVANFDVGGGGLFIGSAFENLVDGGSAKKQPGKGFEGTTAVRLQDDTATSNIVSKIQDVSMYDRIEGTFMFQFLGMEASEAQSDDPDNLLVEVQIDGGNWQVAGDYIMDGATYANGQWNVACFQIDLPESASTLAIRFVAGGDTGHTDFIYLDDVSIAGRPKENMDSYECTDDSSNWSILMFESFEYAGGANNIGSIFIFGGSTGDDASQKVATGNPGTVSHTGSRSVRLKDNSDASRIYTVPLDVSAASRVELSFYFKFRGMDDQDNFFVERQFDGDSSWTVVSDIVKMGTNYLNDVWYKHCVQLDLGPGTSTLSIQVRADGQEGDTDIIFVDDFELKYMDGSMS